MLKEPEAPDSLEALLVGALNLTTRFSDIAARGDADRTLGADPAQIYKDFASVTALMANTLALVGSHQQHTDGVERRVEGLAQMSRLQQGL